MSFLFLASVRLRLAANVLTLSVLAEWTVVINVPLSRLWTNMYFIAWDLMTLFGLR